MSMSRRMTLRAVIMHTNQYTNTDWRKEAVQLLEDGEMEAAYSDLLDAAKRMRARASELLVLEDPQENSDA